MPRGRYSRGYLPHIDEARATQFLTWRLADSLPKQVLQEWQFELEHLPPAEAKGEWQRRIEGFLDAGHGSKLLQTPLAGRIMQEELIEGHEKRYQLHAWCVMPTHVHAVLTPLSGCPLAHVMKLVKGRSSREIARTLDAPKPLWQPDYFDRIIRDEAHFERVVAYVEWNPVKASLVADPALWPFSSANPVSWERCIRAGHGLKSVIPVAE
jgi:REP element-mobilizing transposase RayT